MIKQPSRKKAVITQVVGGYLNTGISITQGLLLLPIYFKFIDFATYGYWVTITSIIAMLGIVNFGIENMVMQRISSSYAKHNFQAVVDYFINSQFLYYIIACILFIIGLVLSFWLQTILSLGDAQLNLLRQVYFIALFTATLTVLSSSVKGFSQALLKPLFGVYSTVFSRIIGIILTVVLLYQNIGLLSIPIGLFVTEILILSSNAIYCFIQYKKLNIKSNLQKNIIFEYLHFSPHFFGFEVGNMLSNKSHPLIITTILGAEMTTAYSVTRKAVEIIDQVVNTFNSSLVGPFSHLVGEGDIEKIKKISIKIISLSFFALMIAFGTYIVTNHLFVSLWINKDIVLSQEIILMMGFGAIAYSMTRLLRNQLFGLNKFKFSSNMILIEGLLFVIFAVFLTDIFGIIGVPFSLLIVSSIIAIFLGLKIITTLGIKYKKQNVYKQLFIVVFIILYLSIIEKFIQKSWFDFVLFSLVSIIVLSIVIYTINYKYFRNIIKDIKLKGNFKA
ncbi:lipopolysaccharide biosynthesis protein [Arcobacter sp. CECT 8985]|uniref:lipopolysaccharide biosynthesis protein n=1 Tax=Arcobacter sp. CECT 8985 TaxID=1935424 RepID=UPI00100B2C75|nr:oligosaccharide flippase family protein [Arcobacter sp. CECT 8985]RXJ84870.1 hypothetical protein CRU93_11890 [Arcobacter sp. CECT 8985]